MLWIPLDGRTCALSRPYRSTHLCGIGGILFGCRFSQTGDLLHGWIRIRLRPWHPARNHRNRTRLRRGIRLFPLVGRSFIKRKFGARIQKVDDFLSRSPFNMALTIRFFPLGSNVVTNILAGVTSIPALPFIFGSTVGYIPQNMVFALFGSGVEVSSTTHGHGCGSLCHFHPAWV